MAKTFLDADMDAELEGMEDSDEEMEEKNGDEEEEEESDEDMDDDEFDKETLDTISNLERDISQNPYNYSAHTQLIDILAKGSDFSRLRSCREQFSKLYPLSPSYWIEWTQDEIKIAASDEDKEMVVGLFDRGVKDYVSVDLWLEYCQYGIGWIGTQEGIDNARSVYERSLTACGLHTGKGSLLWESYREFETALLSLQAPPSTPEQTKVYNNQKNRILNLFKRQLRLPFLDMDSIFNEYKEFVGGSVDPNVQREYQKAKEKLKKIQQFEVDVSDKEHSLEVYKEYLKHELKEKDPARIQLLYERTLTDHCLDGTIWEEYLAYLDTNLRIETVCLPVYERAVRNCPWSPAIWADYMRSLERFEAEHKVVVQVFEECLAVGFNESPAYLEVWLAYVDYTRRRTEFGNEEAPSMTELRIIFDRAVEHLNSVGGDPECLMLKYYANAEAEHFRNMINARKIWADILLVHPFKSSIWLEAIQFEKIFGDKKHLRKRFERALEKTHDAPETIAASWLQFEREEGSLEAFDHCKKLIAIKMGKITSVREKEGRMKQEADYSQQAKIEKKKEKDKEYRRDKRQQASQEKRSKVAVTENKLDGFKMPPPAAPGAKKVFPPPGYIPPAGGKTVAPPPGYIPPTESDEPPAKRAKIDESSGDGSEAKLRTVFVSNLDFDVNENKIIEILGSSGNVKEVRLVKHPNGKSKGFAFVEFSSVAEAQAAMKRDNELINGRPVYISECKEKGDPEKKVPVFKFQTGLEKKKLFIKGLDYSVTKEELTEIFSEFGSLADLRLVTYRNGHSKGLAFVDFNDEVAAAKALIKTDGMKIKEKEISVALSNPPKRKEEATGPSQGDDARSLGGTHQKDFGPRGKGRSQIAFMPRSVSISVPAKPDPKLLAMKFVRPAGTTEQNGAKKEENGAQKEENGAQKEENDTNQSSESKEPAKSNDDFRKLLLGSK